VAIEKMILLNMTFDRSDLEKVLFQLKDMKSFYPQSATKIVHNVKGVHTFLEDSLYKNVKDRLIQIASDMKLELNDSLKGESFFNYHKTDVYLKELENEITKIKSVLDQLIKEKQENEMTYKMLEHLTMFQVDLDQLNESRYMKARFGRLKRQNLNTIQYYDGRPFIFHKLGEDHDYVWCCYIVTNNILLEVDNIFQALGFEEVKIPLFVHGTIAKAKQELKDQINAMEEYILRVEQKMTILRETHKIDILKLYSTIDNLKEVEEYKNYVVDYQSQCAIYGFISTRCLDKLKQQLNTVTKIEYQELPADILQQTDVRAPMLVHNAKIVKPFEALSQVKPTDRIDTSAAFAILYWFVFVIFLGDLGVGAVLTLLGFLMRKKKMGPLLLSLGIAAMIGGLIYGNVFYMIDLYHAIAFPLTKVYQLIDGFVLLSVGTYTIRTFQQMYGQDLSMGRVFSFKGICGLVIVYALLIYLGCVYEVHMNFSIMPFAIVIVACLSLIIVRFVIKEKMIH